MLEGLGLGYEAVRAVNPRVIYASSQGYGSTGPFASMPAYGPLNSGFTGVHLLWNHPETLKTGKRETLKPRLPESPKAEKYSTQLPPSLIKRIKQHALEQDIKDYEVVQFALEAYLPKKK